MRFDNSVVALTIKEESQMNISEIYVNQAIKSNEIYNLTCF